MPTYKGNIGHLMQHWTLCELLAAAKRQPTIPRLNFIDAHAMAPWATESTDRDARFTRVRNALPGQGSVYEKAWQGLADQWQIDGYPNSAAFVREVWKGDYSLLLCERDPETTDEIRRWLRVVGQTAECKKPELFPNDWRQRFQQGLPGPAYPENFVTVVSFDPNMYSWHDRPQHLWNQRQAGRNIYPQDLELVMCALKDVKGEVLIQLSTYTANGDNTQENVIQSVDAILNPYGFHRRAKVRPLTADRRRTRQDMMSLVYARGVNKWSAKLAGISARFEKWMRHLPHQ